MVIDPTEREELVANGVMVIGMNKHREICLLQMTGDMLLLQEQVGGVYWVHFIVFSTAYMSCFFSMLMFSVWSGMLDNRLRR